MPAKNINSIELNIYSEAYLNKPNVILSEGLVRLRTARINNPNDRTIIRRKNPQVNPTP